MKPFSEITKNIAPQGSETPIQPTSNDIGSMPYNEVVEMFRREINKGRVGTKYKPMTFIAMREKVKHLTKQDLHFLMKACERGESFSKVFFGSLKVKK